MNKRSGLGSKHSFGNKSARVWEHMCRGKNITDKLLGEFKPLKLFWQYSRNLLEHLGKQSTVFTRILSKHRTSSAIKSQY